jgi:hypothetical protein
MDEAKTERAETISASDEMAKAKFEAQIRAHREKTARLRADGWLGWKLVGSNDARILLQT